MRLTDNTALFFYDLIRNNAAISCSWAWSSIVIPTCRPSRFNNKNYPKLIRSLFLALSVILLIICSYGDKADSYYYHEQRAISEGAEIVFTNSQIIRQDQTERRAQYPQPSLHLTAQMTGNNPVQAIEAKEPDSASTNPDRVLVQKVCTATQEYISDCMGMLNRPRVPALSEAEIYNFLTIKLNDYRNALDAIKAKYCSDEAQRQMVDAMGTSAHKLMTELKTSLNRRKQINHTLPDKMYFGDILTTFEKMRQWCPDLKVLLQSGEKSLK